METRWSGTGFSSIRDWFGDLTFRAVWTLKVDILFMTCAKNVVGVIGLSDFTCFAKDEGLNYTSVPLTRFVISWHL